MSKNTEAVYTTATPQLYSKFFSEENPQRIREELERFEKCHGFNPSIKVEFFKQDSNGISHLITDDNASYGGVIKYNFSDEASSKSATRRLLLVTVR